MEDTIAAISTALGVGAISIIRVSGNDAIEIVNKIFKNNNLKEKASHTITYGYIVDGEKIIDEVLVSIMKAPKTFTKEDIVEINCHGGIATTNKILELLLVNGCRLAEPGEFTKRAFLNGRIDLIEAEGIMEVINAKSEKSRELAINQLSGSTSNLIKKLRQDILEILANIEVNIDYPEYEDIEQVTNSMLTPKIENIIQKLEEIISKSESNKLIKEGINVSIIGRPNVGKSSLLNCLLEEEKAIVTDIEGTTRDIVEGKINLNGIILNIIDTAGIRKTEDTVEKIGVQKSLELIEKSDLVLYMLNNNDSLTEEDVNIIENLSSKSHIIVINKSDLETKLEKSKFQHYIEISVKDNKGIEDLKNKILELFNFEKIETSDLSYLSDARSIALLKKSLSALLSAREGVFNNYSIDMIEIDIKEAWNLLGEIIGETYQEELINQLFSQFCLGK
ncbi:MAG: tRNA uridine-5-carboxymethylaminomethyl(34) synthesis GTPase MnmE [Firmicutes bacterium]|nr:tRNA uridine-5-carboxymethylaminomethyl(34) synthesis GTPase MnmE [Bacillota bacterium]